MAVSTQGYGGRSISKGVSVYTNDPSQPRFGLSIVGQQVERFVTITQPRIRLSGEKGRIQSAGTMIQPAAGYPFAITDVYAEKGDNIRFRLDRQASGYMLTVENRPEAGGVFSDKIRLKTDNPRLPEIEVSVYGNLRISNP